MLPLDSAAIGVFLVTGAATLGSNLLYFRVRREVNEALPPEQQWSAWGHYPGKMSLIMKAHRLQYPRSRLRTAMYVFDAVWYVSSALFAFLFVRAMW
jgi:hypothetical protein